MSHPKLISHLSFFFQDPHESDSDKDVNVEDSPRQEVCKTNQETESEPKVFITGTHRGMDPSQIHVISTLTDGAGCCQPHDSEKEHLCKLCSGSVQSCVNATELHRHLQDLSIPNSLLHSAQVNTWNSCATTDRAALCGLSLAAAVRTPGAPGFPISLQQHALVQVHRQNRETLIKTRDTLRTHFIITPESS